MTGPVEPLPAISSIGAGRYERAETRTTERNGHRHKTVATKGGDVEIAIAKLKKGCARPFHGGTRIQ